jgi:coatomer protein complex subunit alpha (xenin)
MDLEDDEFHDATGDKWDDDDLFDDEDGGDNGAINKNVGKSVDNNAWGDDDLDLSDDEPIVVSPGIGKTTSNDGFFSAPVAGNPPTLSLCESSHCADHFASGSVDSAVQLLNRQIAATNVAPLKVKARSLCIGSSMFIPGIPLVPSTKSYLFRSIDSAAPSKSLPSLTLSVNSLLEQLRQAYRHFSNAQLTDCKEVLDEIIHSIPLTLATNRTEGNDLKELLEVSKEYIAAIKVKNAMTEAGAANDTARSLELAAYFTHCNLQSAHTTLALKSAMASAFKAKNFVNAASFARRLLEMPEMGSEKNADSRVKAQKVLQKSEQQGRNEFEISYDEKNPFTLDCATLKPIYRGSPSIKCPYCFSSYSPDYKGKKCVICNVSNVGIDTVGLVTQSAASKWVFLVIRYFKFIPSLLFTFL